MTKAADREIWTPTDVASYFGCSLPSARKLMRESLPFFLVGRLMRVRRVDVMAFVAERAVKKGAA